MVLTTIYLLMTLKFIFSASTSCFSDWHFTSPAYIHLDVSLKSQTQGAPNGTGYPLPHSCCFSLEPSSLPSHPCQKLGSYQTHVTAQEWQESHIISMFAARMAERAGFINRKKSREGALRSEGSCWDHGHVAFKVRAGHPGGEFLKSVGNATVHDRLLILVA